MGREDCEKPTYFILIKAVMTMVYDIYSKLAKRNVRNYFVLALWLMVMTVFLLKKVMGWSLVALGFVYPTVLFIGIITLLLEVLQNFVLLRLLKVRMTFGQAHNRIAVISIAGTILNGFISMLFYHQEIIWRTTGAIINAIGLLCIVYVVDKIYAMTRKQKITFVTLNLILGITGRILLAVFK